MIFPEIWRFTYQLVIAAPVPRLSPAPSGVLVSKMLPAAAQRP